MNILILGDIMGPSGREAVIKKLPNLIKKKKLDFLILNGENTNGQARLDLMTHLEINYP